jgi:hypothetical protein
MDIRSCEQRALNMHIVKQYGEMRTGTNVLRERVMRSWEDVLMLMHVLGDKHSTPAPFADIWHQVRKGTLDRLQFAAQATKARPAITTDALNEHQVSFVRRWASPIADAYQQGTLKFVISIRSPAVWLVSLRRFETVMLQAAPIPASVAAKRFTAHYRAWIDCAESHNFTWVVVRHEDLMADCDTCMRRLRAALSLPPIALATIALPTKEINPCVWDDCEITFAHNVAFPAREQRSSKALSANDRHALRTGIDWGLMAALGYSASETL